MAAILGMIGTAVYTSLGPPGNNCSGFAFAWSVVALTFLAGFCQIISARKLDDDKDCWKEVRCAWDTFGGGC